MFQSLYLYISISLLSSPIFKFNIQKHISSQYEKKKCIKLTMWTWSLFRTEGGSEKSLLVWKHKSPNLLGFGCLLWQEHSLDVWQYTSLGNGHTAQKLVQLFIVTDGKLQMTGVDPGLLVVTGCVAGQLEDLSCQIFHDSCQVDWCTGSYTLGIVTLAQETMNTTYWELKSSPCRSALGLGPCFSSFTTSRHIEVDVYQRLFQNWMISTRTTILLIYPRQGSWRVAVGGATRIQQSRHGRYIDQSLPHTASTAQWMVNCESAQDPS